MNASAITNSETFDCRQAFAETLIELAHSDSRIVAVCNDSVGSSNLGQFQKLFPDRLINVGIAEQDMVGVSAGLANGGFIPFVCGAAPFLTGRALEQIKVDAAYNGLPIVLCGMSPGMAYGELGPTHHSIEDLSWLRAIDGLAIIVPADPELLRRAFLWREKRKVQRDATIALQGNRYQVEPQWVGRTLELRFDPFDLSQMELYLDGQALGLATVLTQTRQRHIAVARAATDPPGPPPAQSSLDFLAALRAEHQAQQGRELGQLAFADLPPSITPEA
jgi:deoxyxylulose-5-phosphate synthase